MRETGKVNDSDLSGVGDTFCTWCCTDDVGTRSCTTCLLLAGHFGN